MPVFYFHLRNGHDFLRDPEGSELLGPEAIAARALLEARCIMSHDILEGSIDFDQRIDVEDGSGAIVHSLQFCDAVAVGPREIH